MRMESFIQIFIIIHAGFGGIALIAGFIALISKKGRKIHKKSGRLFFYAMLLSAVTALFVAIAPLHENPFLFSIGIFSIYFLLIGYRSIRFKKKNASAKTERIISAAMMFVALGMILLPLILNGVLNIVLTVFGGTALIFTIRNLKLYMNPEKLNKSWLKLHLGNMIGGYIAATTAFVVVNNFFPSLFGWFVPGIIGGAIIIYWIRKLNRQKIPNTVLN